MMRCAAVAARRVGRLATAACAMVVLAGAPARAQKGADALLDRLVGKWLVSGTIRGKPTAYRAEGKRVLGGKFVRLTLREASDPPRYDAIVMLGLEAKTSRWVAHWMDDFGPTPGATLGWGPAGPAPLVILFEYPDGPMRDTFTFPAGGGWTLLVEQRDAKGAWSTFATYTARRKPR
ncbi:MAG: DUF1579 family protein [Gemmatimonadetes bacterium]|nr:DUF1579 family protein [Gemmatimonadota bacterium]